MKLNDSNQKLLTNYRRTHVKIQVQDSDSIGKSQLCFANYCGYSQQSWSHRLLLEFVEIAA